MLAQGHHIALFIDNLRGGGAQWQTLTLANAFAVRGYHVDLVLRRVRGPLLQEVSSSVRMVPLSYPLRPRLFRFGATAIALMDYLRREQPDVLMSAANSLHSIALWARFLTGVRTRLVVRVSTHLSRSAVNAQRRPRRLRLWQARFFYAWADAVIAVSQGAADDIARLSGIIPERIFTIYNPVVAPELAKRMREHLEHPWFTPENLPVILAAGRLAPQKDFPTLLKAFARVRAVREARLMILGEGKERVHLESLARKLNVVDDVDFPGYVTNPLPYMARAAVFVLSSAWEGLPGVLVEALACGCPVVSTDCPSGPAEILENGRYGPLVPVGDDEALANAILSVLTTPPDRERVQARAALFSADQAVNQYLEILLPRKEPKNAPVENFGDRSF
jgi:glycosyltransferase involved in cell wall biosynthesis